MKVDVIITCKNRFDLLEETLDSYLKYEKDNIGTIYVYDDSGEDCIMRDWMGIQSLYEGVSQVKITRGSKNIGQVAALDFLIKHVQTEYYIGGEEDFVMTQGGFVEEALKAIENPLIVSVSGRGRGAKAMNGHPSVDGFLSKDYHGWTGWSYAPTLHRKSDYKKYSDIVDWRPKTPWQCEKEIGKVISAGRSTYLTEKEYFRHTGGGRSTLTR